MERPSGIGKFLAMLGISPAGYARKPAQLSTCPRALRFARAALKMTGLCGIVDGNFRKRDGNNSARSAIQRDDEVLWCLHSTGSLRPTRSLMNARARLTAVGMTA